MSKSSNDREGESVGEERFPQRKERSPNNSIIGLNERHNINVIPKSMIKIIKNTGQIQQKH
jgi:hypothetical protein